MRRGTTQQFARNMQYGTTCVVSGVSAVPEVCGNAAYYVNPYNLLDMQSRILQALNEPIPERRVLARFEEVSARQRRDLEKAIDIMLGVT